MNPKLSTDSRAEEVLLREMTQNGNEVLWLQDLETSRVIYVSPAFEKLWERSSKELETHPLCWMDSLVEEDRERVEKAYLRGIQDGAFEEVYRIKRPSGEVLWILDRFFKGNPSESLTNYFVRISADISERMHLEERVKGAERMEAIGKIAGGVAHDFNNLLAVIQNYAYFLSDEFSENEQARSDLAEIQNATKRATELTKQLLAFSRRQTFQPDILDVNRVLKDLNKMLRRVVPEDVETVLDLSDDVRSICADRAQIEEIIMNLAISCRQHMSSTGKIVIQTANRDIDSTFALGYPGMSAGSYVVISLSTSSGHFTSQDLKNVFEPFGSGNLANEKNGFGLAAVYGVVKQNQGYISAQNQDREGFAFLVFLPKAQGVARAIETKVVDASKKISGRILLVEDDDSLRRAVRRILEHSGYEVVEARHGKDALSVYDSLAGDIQLLFTDVVMPEMGGVQLKEEIVKRRPDMPVLFMSGYADETLSHHGAIGKDVTLIQKPFSPQQLLSLVREVLSDEQS